VLNGKAGRGGTEPLHKRVWFGLFGEKKKKQTPNQSCIKELPGFLFDWMFERFSRIVRT
jgi:hypothetical protein